MKRIFLLVLPVLFCCIHSSFAQKDTYASDPQVIYGTNNHVINTQQNFLDYIVFTNTNLTQQAFPQNEPSVRISRVNSNIVVAAWRDFRMGYNPAIRRVGYSYSTNGGITWSVSQLFNNIERGYEYQRGNSDL